MMSLRAFFAMSSFHPALLFALSAWICSLATIIGSLMVVHLELLWLGLEYLEFCGSSDTPQCEHHPCDTLPDSDPLLLSNGMTFGLVPLPRDIGVVS